MWFRIVDFDRYLCLMLGLPQGSLDRNMAYDTCLAEDTLLGRVERVHCVIASRILERNELPPSSWDPVLTETLDVELQNVAKQVPSKWWLVPNLHLSPDPQALFWDTRRLFAQVLHYHLLNQLHLPNMLRSSITSLNRRQEYSLITCVNASREMLSRFIAMRSFNGNAYSCRTIDFIVLMAAMTLLLAHLDSHRLEGNNLLAHQYHSDRAMIEQVKASMEQLNHVNSDALSARIAERLSLLLTIDDATVNGDEPRSIRTVSAQDSGAEGTDTSGDLIVHLPCFGMLKIERNGRSRDLLDKQPKSQNDLSGTAVSIDGTTPLGTESHGDEAWTILGSPEHLTTIETVSSEKTPFDDAHNLHQSLTQDPKVLESAEDWAS